MKPLSPCDASISVPASGNCRGGGPRAPDRRKASAHLEWHCKRSLPRGRHQKTLHRKQQRSERRSSLNAIGGLTIRSRPQATCVMVGKIVGSAGLEPGTQSKRLAGTSVTGLLPQPASSDTQRQRTSGPSLFEPAETATLVLGEQRRRRRQASLVRAPATKPAVAVIESPGDTCGESWRLPRWTAESLRRFNADRRRGVNRYRRRLQEPRATLTLAVATSAAPTDLDASRAGCTHLRELTSELEDRLRDPAEPAEPVGSLQRQHQWQRPGSLLGSWPSATT